MEAQVPDAPIKIRYKGVFDFVGAYRYVHHWMSTRQLEFHEKLYKDKVDTAFGNEVEIEVFGERKVTEYVKYRVDATFHLWESKDVTVTINGRQVKRTEGRIEVKIWGTMSTDWQNEFKSHAKLKKFMEDYVLKRELEAKYIGPLDADIHALATQVKKVLGLEAA